MKQTDTPKKRGTLLRGLGIALLLLLVVVGLGARPSSAATSGVITITGTKFNDVNGNGVQDPGETGLAGWTVYLDLNNNGKLDAGEPSGVSVAGGAWSIPYTTEILTVPVTYQLREVQHGGWKQTTTTPCLVVVIGTEVQQTDCVNIGNQHIPEVPEADTLWLFGAGALALVGYLAYQRKMKPNTSY